MAAVRCAGPPLNAVDVAHTGEALNGFLEAGDKRTAIEYPFGDPADRTLGFTPHGLSPWADLALALNDARSRQALGRWRVTLPPRSGSAMVVRLTRESRSCSTSSAAVQH